MWKLFEHLSQTEIRNRLAGMGLKVGHGNISNTLRNPFYCGILSNKLLEGKVVAGKHEKIISQEIFLAVNELLNTEGRRDIRHISDNEFLPLRRMLICSKCQTNMTGYCVKKKNLYYYKCSKLGCCVNKSAIAIHSLFADVLKNIRLNEDKNPTIKKQLTANFIKVDNINRKSKALYKGNLTTIKTKMEHLEERFALGEINERLFKKFNSKLEQELKDVELLIDKSKAGLSSQNFVKQEGDEILQKLANVWLRGDLHTKRLVQSAIFPEGIYFDHLSGTLLIKQMASGFYCLEGEQNVKTFPKA